MDIVAWGLVGQVLLLARLTPIFSEAENENFTMTPVGTLCFLTLRNPPMEIRGIIGDICCTDGSH